MKKILISSLICVLVLSLTGCALTSLFSNPQKSLDKAQAKVTQTENKIQNDKDEIVENAATYVYGANLTLNSDTNLDKYGVAAQNLINHAAITLGQPSLYDASAMGLIVSNLLSENAKIIAEGDKELAKMDSKVIKLQNDKIYLQSQLDGQNAKLTKVVEENTSLAETWAKIKKWISWGGIILIACFVVRAIAAVCPPPWNSVAGIIATPFALIIKGLEALIPESIKLAGWVEKEYKLATSDLVNVIDALKKVSPEQHVVVSATVAANVNDSSISAINTVKSENKIVS